MKRRDETQRDLPLLVSTDGQMFPWRDPLSMALWMAALRGTPSSDVEIPDEVCVVVAECLENWRPAIKA